MTDYSDYPKSIAEIRADRSGNEGAGIWTPRDALIAALRDIDSGVIKPTSISIIAATIEADNDTNMNYYRAVPNSFYNVGMLTAAIKDAL